MTERLNFIFSFSCIGEGNGNPFQCSCLENPRDGGGWWVPRQGLLLTAFPTLLLLLLLLSCFSPVRLCDPIDGSPPGSPIPGIFQARTLEWVTFPSPMHESEK